MVVTSSLPADTTRLKRRSRWLWSRAENTDLGVADHRDRTGGQVGRLGVATNPHAVLQVEEAHPVAAADRHPAPAAILRSRSASGGPPRHPPPPPRSWRRSPPPGSRCRRPELGLEGGVGDGQHGQVDRAGQVGQGGEAGEPRPPAVARVGPGGPAPEPAPECQGPGAPERLGPGAGPHHRHRPGLEQGREGGGRRDAQGRGERAMRPTGSTGSTGLTGALGLPAVGQDGLDGLPAGMPHLAAGGGRAGR